MSNTKVLRIHNTTDEIVYMTADEELDHYISQAAIKINENGEIEVFETKEWNIEDIANKINEIIELLNEITKK